MAKAYTADEWNKKKKIDADKVASEKKKKTEAAKKKVQEEAEKQPGYLAPSGSAFK